MSSAAQRQFLASVQGIEGYWSNKTGANTTAAVTDVWNGGALVPDKIASPATTANVRVERPWDPDRDTTYLHRLRDQVGRWRTTVTVQPTDADLTPSGPPDVYANALLVTFDPPDLDASSGASARWALEFAVTRAA